LHTGLFNCGQKYRYIEHSIQTGNPDPDFFYLPGAFAHLTEWHIYPEVANTRKGVD
jgi:hypothetical protein